MTTQPVDENGQRLHPQRMRGLDNKGDDNWWWYEEERGICVVRNTMKGQAFITWPQIRAALKRKDGGE